MKKHALYAATLMVLILAGIAAGVPAAAQDDSSQPSRAGLTPEQVVAKLDSQLSLSEDQKAKITPIIADRQEKLRALQSESMRPRKKAREVKEIFQDSDQKIESVLTSEQKPKYEQMEQEVRQELKERRQQRNQGSSGGSN